jgi:hypothetical protein
MRNYKLIKTYPGSPKLGYITKEGVNDGIDDPKDHPEFWKELIEPKYVKCIKPWSSDCNFTIGKIYTWPQPINDLGLKRTGIYNFSSWENMFRESTKEEYDNQFVDYQILTIKDSISNALFTLRKSGEYVYLLDSRYIIHSVKRKSDGEIFTIGDRVSVNTTNYDSRYSCCSQMGKLFTIENFLLSKDLSNFPSAPIGMYVYYNNFNITINYLNKVRVPLFTTEDNVPIYEGDEYWYIFDTNPTLINHSMSAIPLERRSDIKRFSTKQAAKEHIVKNTVLFVTDDGVNLYKGDKCHHLYKYDPTGKWRSNIIITGQFGKMDGHMYFSTKQALDDYVKKVEVLFVTEDGVAVKEGDDIFGVTSSFLVMTYTNISGSYWKLTKIDKDDTKYFSIKEKAQEYINLNKPKYSVNQIKEAFRDLNLDLTVAIRICVHIANTDSK